jgi:hypothetical protein
MNTVAASGSDFLDDFELADSSIGLYLPDVSRPGLPAAFFSSPGRQNAPQRTQNGNLTGDTARAITWPQLISTTRSEAEGQD